MKRYSWLALAFIGLLLLGWRPLAAQNESVITVTLWHPYSGQQQTQLATLIARYNAENSDNVTVQTLIFNNSGLLYDQIILQLINPSSLPNLALIWPHDAALFDLNDNLADLAQFESPSIESWLPPQVGYDPIRQKQIALPHTAFGMVLAVNLDALAELGYSDLPTTWDDLQVAACALRENGGWSGGQFGTAWGFTATLEAETWLGLSGEQSLFEDGRYLLDSPALYESAETLKAMQDTGCLILETDRASAYDTFASGRALFLLLPSSGLAVLQSAIQRSFVHPFAWGAFIPPTSPAVLVYTPVISMFDSNPTVNRAAWDFMTWFLSPAVNSEWASATNTFPIHATTMLSENALSQAQQLWSTIQNHAVVPLPTLAGYDVVRLEIRFALQRLLAGTTPPTDEIPALETLANQITLNFYGLSEEMP